MPVSNRKPEIYSFCGEVLTLTWLFFQTGGSCVVCNSKILCCYILFKNLWLAKKIKHKNQRTVSHVLLSENDILKKMWRYRTLRIQPKFAKFLEICYRRKLQYLQSTASCKGTTNLRRLVEVVNWGNDQFFQFHKLGWSGNKLKHLGAGYMGSFISPYQKPVIMVISIWFLCLGYMAKDHPSKVESSLPVTGSCLNWMFCIYILNTKSEGDRNT